MALAAFRSSYFSDFNISSMSFLDMDMYPTVSPEHIPAKQERHIAINAYRKNKNEKGSINAYSPSESYAPITYPMERDPNSMR